MNIEEITDSFLKSLNQRTFELCDDIVEKVKNAASDSPSLTPYYLYFSATLLDERENNWTAAREMYESVLAHSTLPNTLRCNVLQSVSLLLRKQGLWDSALDSSNEALLLAHTIDNHDIIHKILVGQGIIYSQGFSTGDYGASVLPNGEACCLQALSYLGSNEKHSNRAAGAWNTLGTIYRAMNRNTDAIDCFQNLLQIGYNLENGFYIAHASNNLGVCYLYLQQWSEAIEAHHRALDLFQNNYDRLDVYAHLGYLYQITNQFEKAIANYDHTINLIDVVQSGLTAEEARTNFATTVADVYANAVLTCDAASKDPNIPKPEQQAYQRRAFNYMEQARSRTFLDLLHSDSLELDQNFRAEPLTIDQVQDSLPDDALLLCFFTTGTLELPDARAQSGEYRRHRFPDDRIIALAVTNDALYSHTSTLSPNLLYPQNKYGDIVRDHFLAAGIQQSLYFNLVKPFESLLKNRRVLYIVPHGPLHYVPFQAMPTGDGQTLLNRRGPRIVYAPSASVLLRDRATDADSDAAADSVERDFELNTCLAIGYNGTGDDRLLLAENEAVRVAELTAGQSLTGPQKKKDALFEVASTYQSLYFSCHGTFNADNPLESALLIGENEWLTAKEALTHLAIRDCDLVILCACQTGLNHIQRGDELFGLMRAFMIAGASMLILTQWKVDQWSTRLIIEEFTRQIQAGESVAEALHQSQLYLRSLSRDKVLELLSNSQVAEIDVYLDWLRSEYESTDLVYADPYYWASFILIGDSL